MVRAMFACAGLLRVGPHPRPTQEAHAPPQADRPLCVSYVRRRVLEGVLLSRARAKRGGGPRVKEVLVVMNFYPGNDWSSFLQIVFTFLYSCSLF